MYTNTLSLEGVTDEAAARTATWPWKNHLSRVTIMACGAGMVQPHMYVREIDRVECIRFARGVPSRVPTSCTYT